MLVSLTLTQSLFTTRQLNTSSFTESNLNTRPSTTSNLITRLTMRHLTTMHTKLHTTSRLFTRNPTTKKDLPCTHGVSTDTKRLTVRENTRLCALLSV